MAKPLARQFLDGIRLTGTIGLVLGTFFLLYDGERRTARGVWDGLPAAFITGCVELLTVGILLWFTAAAWSRAVAAVCFIGALKGVASFVAGTAVSAPFQPVYRIFAAEMLAVLLLAGLLSMRFAIHRPNKLEAAGLIVFVFSICANILWERAHFAAVFGLGSLIFVRLAPLLSVTRKGRFNRRDSP